MDVSKAIKAMIDSKGFKQNFIAEKMGLSKSQFSQIINRSDLKIGQFEEIANNIGYDVKIQLVSRDSGKIIEVD